ncbi:MAG: hypothetical protein PF484_01995 [Bacteroidales bacterium]|jgi:nucleoside-triphosphatase|nr:hypothetical protein [Bacteroidales bacterium]
MKETKIYILSGGQGEGKTTRCLEIVNQLKSNGENVGGIVAPGFWDNNIRSGFDLMNVQTNIKTPFAQRMAKEEWIKIKAFYFNPEAIEKGKSILHSAVQENDWIVLDEIGKLDLNGYLWGPIFSDLIKIPNKKWIICVRDIYVDDIIHHWNLNNVTLLQLTDELY